MWGKSGRSGCQITWPASELAIYVEIIQTCGVTILSTISMVAQHVSVGHRLSKFIPGLDNSSRDTFARKFQQEE